jgi:hypothetical protein
MTLKSIQPDDWPDRIHANKAVIRFPNGVESGNWQTKPADDTCEYVRALPAAPAEDVRAGARIIPMHTESMYGVCIGGRWDGWVMVKHPDGYWVSHHKPDPIDPAATFNLINEPKP